MKVKEFLEKMKKSPKPRYRIVKGTRNAMKINTKRLKEKE